MRIDLITNIQVADEASRAKHVLRRANEYFLLQFASAEGKKGGEFYTPRCVVEMLEPYRGGVYGPLRGSSGMFVQSVDMIRARERRRQRQGQSRHLDLRPESNYRTRPLAKMNLPIRGFDGQIAHGDTLHNDRFPDLKADVVLANPPCNVSDWDGERLREDRRREHRTSGAGDDCWQVLSRVECAR